MVPRLHHRPALYWAGGLNRPDGFAWANGSRWGSPRQNGAHLCSEYWRRYLASYCAKPESKASMAGNGDPFHCRTHRISSWFVVGLQNGERGTVVCCYYRDYGSGSGHCGCGLEGEVPKLRLIASPRWRCRLPD